MFSSSGSLTSWSSQKKVAEKSDEVPMLLATEVEEVFREVRYIVDTMMRGNLRKHSTLICQITQRFTPKLCMNVFDLNQHNKESES